MGNFDFLIYQEKENGHALKSLCPPTWLNVSQCTVGLESDHLGGQKSNPQFQLNKTESRKTLELHNISKKEN